LLAVIERGEIDAILKVGPIHIRGQLAARIETHIENKQAVKL